MEEHEEYVKRVGNTEYNKSIEELRKEGKTEEEIRAYVKEADDKRTWGYPKDEVVVVSDEDIHREVMGQIFDKQYSQATETLVNYIEKIYHIYTTREDVKNEVWIYNDGIYTPNGRSYIKEKLREILGKNYSNWFYNQVIAKIEADTYIDTDVFFANPYPEEIVVENGILNVVSRKLSPYTPEKIFFTKIPVKYDPNSRCPNIEKFLEEVLALPEDKLVFYEIAGFGLLKDYKYEKAFMFVGNGRNGKGKSIELLKRLVGAENCTSLSLTSLTPDNFCVSELFGKLFNLAGDLSSTALKETGMFKMLTGRDFVSANRKHRTHITFQNYAKFVFACNELPRVYDYSLGFWDRWIMLEFPYLFVTKEELEKASSSERKLMKLRDEDIINKITTPEELSGLLNLALEGLNRLLSNNRFSYTISTEQIKNTWIRKADSFMAFCLDHIEEAYDEIVPKKELRQEYSKYCKKHKVRGVGDKSIKITLQELFGVSDAQVTLRNGNLSWVWEGIRLKRQ